MTGHTTVRARVAGRCTCAAPTRQAVVVVGDRLREHDVGPLEQPLQQRHLVGGELVHRRDAHARPRGAGRVLEQLPQRLGLAVAVHDEQGSVAVGQRFEPVEVPVVARPAGICRDRPDVARGVGRRAGGAAGSRARSSARLSGPRVTRSPYPSEPATVRAVPLPAPAPRPADLAGLTAPRAGRNGG